ncbi:MAG TPA: PP2C family serine/threonine-protein phosphatase [Acidimicrobiales bacterium]
MSDHLGFGAGTCGSCGEPLLVDDRFCEACGAPVPMPVEQVPQVPPGAAGYGAASPGGPGGPGGPGAPGAADPRDHAELADGPVAAVTDRGRAHWRNEDAVGIRWVHGDPEGFALVVSDGVSVSQEPQVVSQVAVETALLVLSGAVSAGGDLDLAMLEAIAAAQRATSALPYDPALDVGPGACTIVAAAVRGRYATFGSVGDSRAYWVDDHQVVQIGRDDSLAAEMVASGRLTNSQAMARPGAHALTKWLGVDSTDAVPTVTSVELPGPGLVLLASDGLWNYAPDPDDLGRLVGRPGAETALDLARRLVAYAVDAGGADNVTVAVGPHLLGRQEVPRA